jgi:hypothetical protein
MSVSTIDRPVSAVSIDLTQEGLASPQHVPEPSGLALLAAAVGGLLWFDGGPALSLGASFPPLGRSTSRGYTGRSVRSDFGIAGSPGRAPPSPIKPNRLEPQPSSRASFPLRMHPRP